MARLRGYLIDATYEWIIDHDLTPYLLVDTEFEDVIVPENLIADDGKIVLDMSETAIKNYICDDKSVSFLATFNGIEMDLYMPIESVIAIYAQETDQGIFAKDYGYGMVVQEGDNEDDLDPVSSQNDNNGLTFV